MQVTRCLMGMPITVRVVGEGAGLAWAIDQVFAYFNYIDQKFSPYSETSELSLINQGELKPEAASVDMQTVLRLCEETCELTDGYFDIKRPDGRLDTSGLVKGWAIDRAGQLLDQLGCEKFFIDAGGDIQTRGHNELDQAWSVGLRDPFGGKDRQRIVKVIYLGRNEGVATSGTYLRGQHIYNPKDPARAPLKEVISLTVIGSNIYEADRFATAAFAMGREGIKFIERLKGFEAFQINNQGIATVTSGFDRYTVQS